MEEMSLVLLLMVIVAIVGIVIGVVAVRKRIWPAAIMGWVGAFGAIPFLPFNRYEGGSFLYEFGYSPIPTLWSIFYILAMIYLIIHSIVAIRRRLKSAAQPSATAG